jgi:hybrid polyketide synthase / nonribosomal peptide synthetase ACE1
LARSVTKLAAEKKHDVVCVKASSASTEHERGYPAIFIPAHASSRSLRRALPPRVALLIDFTENNSSISTLVSRLQNHLPNARVERGELFHARHLNFDASLPALFQEAVLHSVPANLSPGKDGAVVSADAYVADAQQTAKASSVIDWTSSSTVPVEVKPSDALPVLRGDRTYLLFGLGGAGGLGLPLAEYMVSLGARYIVLTSRKPAVDLGLIEAYAARSVRIQAVAK